MKKFSLVLLIITAFVSASFSQKTEKQVFFKDCSAKEFKSNLETQSNYILIDLRPVKEFKRSRIKTAKNVQSIESLLQLMSKYDKNTPIFIYCNMGDKSLTAAAMLMRNGYKKIYHLTEGIDGWYGDGYKLCKEKITTSDLVKL